LRKLDSCWIAEETFSRKGFWSTRRVCVHQWRILSHCRPC